MKKIEFTGAQGDILAARLDMPSTAPKAYALFAHCFTCSKDIFAASRIAKSLSDNGIAVLRFDFTGLGASEGEFANTNFSSNVQDLIKAAAYMKEHLRAPSIVIGHSLGGAAVLAAAADIPEAKAIVTIGAPADAAHVAHHFDSARDEIMEKGEAEVKLVGRPFRIQKQFIDDIEAQNMQAHIKNLKRALLVMHAPLDETVGIENATNIFVAAKHPKSFISLDDADHLLSKRADAQYAANVIAAWASRYAEYGEQGSDDESAPEAQVTVKTTGEGKFQNIVHAGNHTFFADEPKDMGGTDSGPAPYDLLLASLGACTSMTLKMYAEHKDITLGGVEVYLNHEKTQQEGSEEKVDKITRAIKISGDDVTPKQKARMIEIADKCPVHKTLHSNNVIIETKEK